MKIVITGRNFSAGDDAGLRLLQSRSDDVEDHSAEDLGVGTDRGTVIRMLKDADIAVMGLEPADATVLSQCPKLKLISRRGIGYDNVDLAYCREHGITLARTAGLVEAAVAEHVMAYILYFARNVGMQNGFMQKAEWHRVMMPGAKGRTLGLIGFGGIGKEIARRAVPFGMRVVCCNRHPDPEAAAALGAEYLSMEELLAESDYVSVNVPLTDTTRGMCGAEMFARMKPGSVFINIARGPVMDTAALRKALDSGHLRGAAVDVFDKEPCTDSPLVGCPTALLTPHTASYTSENFSAMNDGAARNVIDWMDGRLRESQRVV